MPVSHWMEIPTSRASNCASTCFKVSEGEHRHCTSLTDTGLVSLPRAVYNPYSPSVCFHFAVSNSANGKGGSGLQCLCKGRLTPLRSSAACSVGSAGTGTGFAYSMMEFRWKISELLKGALFAPWRSHNGQCPFRCKFFERHVILVVRWASEKR